MSITADAGDSFEGEVKGNGRKACAGEEGDKKRAKAAVDMEGELALLAECETRQGGDVVDDSLREIRGGTYK